MKEIAIKNEQEFIHIMNMIQQQSDDNRRDENNLVLSIAYRLSQFVDDE